MTDIELKSCIGTIEMLRRLHGVMNVIDAGNCEKIIKVLSDLPKYKDAYNKGWDDGAKATYEHLKMCEEEQGGDLISRDAVWDVMQELWGTSGELIDRLMALPSIKPQPCEDSNANQHNSNALNALEGDAISRQVLDEIKELMTDINGDTVYAVKMSDIRQLPSVNPQEPKWIPVSERLPEHYQNVLFSTKTDRVFEGRYFKDETEHQWYSFRDECFAWNNVVTAWMPLPEPYKAESEDEE